MDAQEPDLATDLRRARALVARASDWTRGTIARDAQGNPCNADRSTAVAYSGTGAIGAACMGLSVERFSAALLAYAEHLPADTTVDELELTHHQVLAAFDQAIAKTESEAR